MRQWPGIGEAIQESLNQWPVGRIGKIKQRLERCPVELFTGLEPSTFPVPPLPMKKNEEMRALGTGGIEETVGVGIWHQILTCVRRDVTKNITLRHTGGQKWHTINPICCP